MKFRGPGSSIRPAREAARAQERSRNPQYHGSAQPVDTALVGAARSDAMQVGEWTLATDEDGNLTAAVQGGEPQVIAHRDDQEDGA